MSRARLFRFSLKALLILLTLACFWLGKISYDVRQQRIAVAWIKKNGGGVSYDGGSAYQDTASVGTTSSAPKWPRAIVGDDYFQTVTKVWIIDAGLTNISPLAALPDLELVNLKYNRIRDISLLATHTELRHLILAGNQISDVSPLRKLTKLEYINLEDNRIKDVAALRGVVYPHPSLLNLKDNEITDWSPLDAYRSNGVVFP